MSTRVQSLACLPLWLLVSAANAQFPNVEIKVKYLCRSEGRSWSSSNGGEKHYCWEGKHYSKSTGGVPAFVLGYWAEHERESAQRSGEMKRIRENLTARAAANRTAAAAARTTTVEQSQRPIHDPIPLDLFNTLESGVERAAVVAKLGQPHGSIANLGAAGDEESMTYLVENGGNASIRLKQGKLLTIQLPHP